MISLRENLPKIGIEPGTPVSFMGKIPFGNGSYHPGNFVSRPKSLREAIRSMDAPQNWQQVSDPHYDEYWTDEVQGVGFDGSNWIFSCNANQSKPGHNDKAIYVFKGGQPLKDGNWICRVNYKDVPHPTAIAGRYESDDHWGQLTCYKGFVYVAYSWDVDKPWEYPRSVVVFKNNNGFLEYRKWIPLPQVTSPTDGMTGWPEFQAINPWDGKCYTSLESSRELFIHNLDTGEWKGKALGLHGFLPGCYIQGACFSDNGHLYVSVDNRFSDWGRDYHWIFCYSALNGAFLGKIPVLATDDDHELEGICYANVSWPDGRIAQIHAVLLENIMFALDNIWFKSFSADRPEVV